MSIDENVQLVTEEPDGEPTEQDTTTTDAATEPIDGEPAAAAASRKYAGIYDSEEELENGYKNLQAFATKAAQEAAELRRQLAQNAQERTVAAPAEGSDIVERLKTVYPDHPELHELAAQVAKVKQEIAGQVTMATRQSTAKVYSELLTIHNENADLLKDPATLQMFLAEADERMPVKTTYLDLARYIETGGVIEPDLSDDIVKRVKASFNAVRRETGRSKKTAEQTKRVASRVDALPSAAAPPKSDKFNLKDDEDYEVTLAKITGRKW